MCFEQGFTQENTNGLKPKTFWRHAAGLAFICQQAGKVLWEATVQVFFSSWYFPVLSMGFWKRECLWLSARESLACSLGKRKFAIHWGQGTSKAASPCTFLTLICKHIKVWETTPWKEMLERIEEERIATSHCMAVPIWKRLRKHEKKEKQSAETEGNGKNGECFNLKLKGEGFNI